MKKLFAGVLFAALFTVSAATVFAGGHGGHHGNGAGYCSSSCNYTGDCAQGRCHADADNDGICDYCGVEDDVCHWGRNGVDADDDGICDNCGYYAGGNGQGRNYVDADNNGVCDNYGTGGNGQGHHTGQGNGHHGGSRR